MYIVGIAKITRLRRIAHEVRSQPGSSLRNVLEGDPGGRRLRGRPRRTEIQDLESDLKELGVRLWRRKTGIIL